MASLADALQERRTSLSLAYAVIAVAIVHRHGWFSGAFAWLKAPAAGSAGASGASLASTAGAGAPAAAGSGAGIAAPTSSQPGGRVQSQP